MKQVNKIISLALLIVLIGSKAFAQGQITSVLPGIGEPGKTMTVVIRGDGTNFVSNKSQVSFGPGITIASPMDIQVINQQTIQVQITIDKTASAGLRNVQVTTLNQVVTKPNGFEVITSTANVRAVLNVTPVQVMKISDFDPNNLANSPVLLNIIIYNNFISQDLAVKLVVSGRSLGELGYATKLLKAVKPNQVITFDNRQFDKYHLLANTNLVNQTIKTGILPSDQYVYTLTVTEANTGNILVNTEGFNNIINAINKPELISPGAIFSADPTQVGIKQPFFQWFAQGCTNFDFDLYQVRPGQSQEEVALTRPIYQEKGLSKSGFLYPGIAQVLEDGNTYAWIITANYVGSGGNQALKSQMFWFKMGKSSSNGTGNSAVAEIKVFPEQLELNAGQSYRFKATAFSINADTVSFKPYWKVIPSDAGTVDQSGYFTAGAQAGVSAAVTASYGDFEDYSTVNIISAPSGTGGDSNSLFSIEDFVRKLYGLPSNTVGIGAGGK